MNKILVTGNNHIQEFVTPEELEMLLYFGFVEHHRTYFDRENNVTVDAYRRKW